MYLFILLILSHFAAKLGAYPVMVDVRWKINKYKLVIEYFFIGMVQAMLSLEPNNWGPIHLICGIKPTTYWSKGRATTSWALR